MRKERILYILALLILIWQYFSHTAKKVELSPYEIIQRDKLLQRNLSGQGIGVALLDFFPMHQHDQLGLKPVSEWRHLRNLPDFRLPSDPLDHGVHVAGIVKRVAPEARIVRLSVTIDPYDFRRFMQDKSLHILSASAFVQGDWLVREIANALKDGKIFILAAGNDSRDISSYFNHFSWILTRLEGVAPDLLDNVILALNLKTSVSLKPGLWEGESANSALTLHQSSNYPGRRYAEIALTAPGENIESELADGKVAPMTGTSMAAPMIAGAAALLMEHYERLAHLNGMNTTTQAYRFMRSRAVVWALRQGATKGQGYPSYQFGQGILNLEKSLALIEGSFKNPLGLLLNTSPT